MWTAAATAVMLSSTLATFLTTIHLRYRWDVHESSVRWLFWRFFLSLCVWCFARSIYFFCMCFIIQTKVLVPRGAMDGSSLERLDCLGIHTVLLFKRAATNPWMTVVICFGDCALMSIAVTLFPLTFELWRLARVSMDRGVKREQLQIRRYMWMTNTLTLAFALVEVVLAVRHRGYSASAHKCLLTVYIVQFIGLVFMVGLLVRLRVNGRKYETIHGTFVASPVYQRLKCIMLVYAIFSFQCQLLSFILYVRSPDAPIGTVVLLGISRMLYNASGLALAITTSCSQSCVISACGCFFPEDFEAQLEHNRLRAGYHSPVVENSAPTAT
ncbi:hypothetical protein ATCC90586_012229 [Pythium insidiosum]|nr:hypothetical protein ATCC90586_012229 [Pythium insidiosum]